MISYNDPSISYSGRVSFENSAYAEFDWSGVFVCVSFSGTGLVASLRDGANYFNVWVDQTFPFATKEPSLVFNGSDWSSFQDYTLVQGLRSDLHTACFGRRSEANQGITAFAGVHVINGYVVDIPFLEKQTRKLEFIGDSVVAGYGNEGKYPCSFSSATENMFLTYASMLGDAFSATWNAECWSGKGLLRNYGSPNITSPDPFPIYWNRTVGNLISGIWTFDNYIPDALVIHLGDNDFTTNPNPPTDMWVSAMRQFVATIRDSYHDHYASIPILFIVGPLGEGNPCANVTEQVVALEPNTFVFSVFGLLIYPADFGCDGHPNVQGHSKMANALQPWIAKILQWY